MKLCMVGSGYVGLTTATIFAAKGSQVVCVDVDGERVDQLRAGELPIYEPGLESFFVKAHQEKLLSFTTDLAVGARTADLIFISVGTPPREDGSVDLSAIETVVRQLANILIKPATIVIKSTVPVGTADLMEQVLIKHSNVKDHAVLSNPEFLREGSAVDDFCRPDRIIIGAIKPEVAEPLRSLYSSFPAPIMVTDRRAAELIKYASNGFLAMKISYINELAALCEQQQVDVTDLAQGMGLDHRIGSEFLKAGVGYGGSCFPKDISALRWMYQRHGLMAPVLAAVERINELQCDQMMAKLTRTLQTVADKEIAVFGLSFKPNTDDIRGAPAVAIIQKILQAGGNVRVYDPSWRSRAATVVPGCRAAASAFDAAAGADALILVTEWEEFIHLNYGRLKLCMRTPIIIDGRNCLNADVVRGMGFYYEGFGRGA